MTSRSLRGLRFGRVEPCLISRMRSAINHIAREEYRRRLGAMTDLVFISHSNADKGVADAICAELERAGTAAGFAPRDITPGRMWARPSSTASTPVA